MRRMMHYLLAALFCAGMSPKRLEAQNANGYEVRLDPVVVFSVNSYVTISGKLFLNGSTASNTSFVVKNTLESLIEVTVTTNSNGYFSYTPSARTAAYPHIYRFDFYESDGTTFLGSQAVMTDWVTPLPGYSTLSTSEIPLDTQFKYAGTDAVGIKTFSLHSPTGAADYFIALFHNMKSVPRLLQRSWTETGTPDRSVMLVTGVSCAFSTIGVVPAVPVCGAGLTMTFKSTVTNTMVAGVKSAVDEVIPLGKQRDEYYDLITDVNAAFSLIGGTNKYISNGTRVGLFESFELIEKLEAGSNFATNIGATASQMSITDIIRSTDGVVVGFTAVYELTGEAYYVVVRRNDVTAFAYETEVFSPGTIVGIKDGGPKIYHLGADRLWHHFKMTWQEFLNLGYTSADIQWISLADFAAYGIGSPITAGGTYYETFYNLHMGYSQSTPYAIWKAIVTGSSSTQGNTLYKSGNTYSLNGMASVDGYHVYLNGDYANPHFTTDTQYPVPQQTSAVSVAAVVDGSELFPSEEIDVDQGTGPPSGTNRITLIPDFLDFGSDQEALTFFIEDEASPTDLNWHITPSRQGILSFSPASGTRDALVTVYVDRSALSSGTYQEYLDIYSTAGTKRLPVTIEKNAVWENTYTYTFESADPRTSDWLVLHQGSTNNGYGQSGIRNGRVYLHHETSGGTQLISSAFLHAPGSVFDHVEATFTFDNGPKAGSNQMSKFLLCYQDEQSYYAWNTAERTPASSSGLRFTLIKRSPERGEQILWQSGPGWELPSGTYTMRTYMDENGGRVLVFQDTENRGYIEPVIVIDSDNPHSNGRIGFQVNEEDTWIDNVTVTSFDNTIGRPNILANGTLESGTTQAWIPYGFGGNIVSIDTDSYEGTYAVKFSVPSSDPNADWKSSFKQTVAVDEGVSYTVTGIAKASENRTLRVMVSKNGGNWDIYNFWKEVSVTSNWKSFSYTFTCDTRDPAAVLLFKAGHASPSVWLDDVQFHRNTAGPVNVLANHNLEAGTLAAWDEYSYRNNAVTVENGGYQSTYAAKFSVPDFDPNEDWRARLKQSIAVKANTQYVIDYWAKAASERTLRVMASQDGGNWTVYNFWEEATLTADWQRFTHTFVCGTGDLAAALLFKAGHASPSVWIDNVVFYEVERGESVFLTYTPQHDSYVNSSDPNNTKDSNNRLQVKYDPSYTWNSYIKFDVSGINGMNVQRATLRLFPTNGSNDGGKLYLVSNQYQGSSNSWKETSLTWNNAPTVSGTPVADIGTVVPNTWKEIDVTSSIAQDGIVSFVITKILNDGDIYDAREAGNPPELVIETLRSGSATKQEQQMTHEEAQSIPSGFILHQNYPNPFNPETVISFTLPKSARVILSVYSILGQRIKTLVDTHKEKGTHVVVWDGTDKEGNKVASGVYLYRIDALGVVKSHKMVLMK